MVDLETKSVKKLVAELLEVVDLGLCSTAILMSLAIFSSLCWISVHLKRGWSGARGQFLTVHLQVEGRSLFCHECSGERFAAKHPVNGATCWLHR